MLCDSGPGRTWAIVDHAETVWLVVIRGWSEGGLYFLGLSEITYKHECNLLSAAPTNHSFHRNKYGTRLDRWFVEFRFKCNASSAPYLEVLYDNSTGTMVPLIEVPSR